jgi:predicted DNA-binding protein
MQQKLNKLRVSIYLSPKQKTDLDKLSEKTGAPVAELVRRSIDAYLEKHK